MILLVIFAAVVSSASLYTPEFSSLDCNTKGKVILQLDMAMQLINTARRSLPNWQNTDLPLDCEDIHRRGKNVSGVYEVWPRNRIISGPISVWCDMETDGGGWTLIQRRGNNSRPKNYFQKNWDSYKKGFGDINEDFWLGNNNIYALSNQKPYSIRFDLEDFEGNKRFALYDSFWIENERLNYTIHIQGFTGDAGDSMGTEHDGKMFSTADIDNDIHADNCAVNYKGGWWYGSCHYSNLNGVYHGGKHESYADGVNWHSWKGYHESLKSTVMKIRKAKPSTI